LKEREKVVEIYGARAWGKMVLVRPAHIMQVTSCKQMSDGSEKSTMIKKREVFFDPSMAEIVPDTEKSCLEFFDKAG
jgi:hypothetical protein